MLSSDDFGTHGFESLPLQPCGLHVDTTRIQPLHAHGGIDRTVTRVTGGVGNYHASADRGGTPWGYVMGDWEILIGRRSGWNN